MTTYDPNVFTLHLSRVAALQAVQRNGTTEVIIRKQSSKKVGTKTIIVKNEIDLTLPELDFLEESLKILKYFLSTGSLANQSSPPNPPPRLK